LGWLLNKKKEIHFTDLDAETREEVLAFTGKKEDFYKKKWEKLSNRGFPFSWNWAAFFFSFFWFAYRKMNVYAYMFIAFLLIMDLFYIIFFKQPTKPTTFGPAFLFVALGSNKIYFDFVLKQVKKMQSLYPNREERIELLQKRGGVSWKSAILFLIIMFVYSFAITLLEEKVYYAYMTPKFEHAVELQNEGKLDEALEMYDAIENQNNPVPGIYFNRAIIYLEKEDYDDALKQINTYLKLSPDDESGLELKEEIINAEKK
jgi:tetratricopeptide (TPR) repeat protein